MNRQIKYKNGYVLRSGVELVRPIRTFKDFYSVIISEKRVFAKDKVVPVSYFMRWDMDSIREYIDNKYIWTYTLKK